MKLKKANTLFILMFLVILSCKEKSKNQDKKEITIQEKVVSYKDYSGNYVSEFYKNKINDWVTVSVEQNNENEIKISVRSRIDIKKPTCTFDAIATKINEITFQTIIEHNKILFDFKNDVISISTKEFENRFILMYYCSGGGSLVGDYTKIDGELNQSKIDKTPFSNMVMNGKRVNESNNSKEKIISPNGIDKVTASTTKETLKMLYSKNQLKEVVVFSLEGVDIMGTEVQTKNPDNNFTIQWDDKTNTPAIIHVPNKNSEWKTQKGIGIGSSIKDVQKANGKVFTIYGYEIDQYLAGAVKDWKLGNLKNFHLQFKTTKNLEGEKYMKIMGEDGITSNNDLLKEAGLVVKNFSLILKK